MLTNLRESVKNSKVIKFVLLLFICAPFAFFGVNSYFGGGGSSYAVKVNGNEVPVRAFEQEFNVQRNRLRQAFGGTIPEGFASDDMLRQQALESLITGELLNGVIEDQDIVVSDQNLAKAITQTEVFQKDGRFDQERYEMQLRSAGLSIDSFESQFRRDVALQDFRDSIVTSNFVLDGEKSTVLKLTNQLRNASYIAFRLDPVLETTTIEGAAVEDFFEQNKLNYMHPERVKIEFIELDSTSMKNDITVTEEDIKAYFDENSSSYRVAEERSASHILLSLEAGASDSEADEKLKKIQELKSKLNSGENFEKLAEQYSEDPGSAENGGSLGFFGKGAMVPEFEEAVFAMSIGEISEPVKSDFGYHLIRLDEIKEERGKEFSAVKSEIEDLLKQQGADEVFYDKSELLSNLSYENPDSLVPAAEAGEFTIQQSDWIDRLSKNGIGANPKIINAALSPDVLAEGNNSSLIELGDNHVVALRVVEHEGPRQKELEEVKEDILEQLKRETARAALENTAKTAMERLQNGEAIEGVSGELGGEYAEPADIERSNPGLDRAVLDALFKLPKPAEGNKAYSTVALPAGDQYVLALNAVKDGESPQAGDMAAQNPIDPQQIGQAEYGALLRHMRNKALVEINQQILQPAAQ